LVAREMLAKRPVLVEQRHPDRGVGVQHLLGADDLDLIGIDVEPELLERDALHCLVGALDGAELPVGTLVEQSIGSGGDAHVASAPAFSVFLANSSRNTG